MRCSSGFSNHNRYWEKKNAIKKTGQSRKSDTSTVAFIIRKRTLKEAERKQLEVIQKSNSVEDDYHTWIRSANDIQRKPLRQYEKTGNRCSATIPCLVEVRGVGPLSESTSLRLSPGADAS